MTGSCSDENVRRTFVELWAQPDLTRVDIARAFGKSASWVQLMTEITGVPPRKTSAINYSRVHQAAPDTRQERRRACKQAASLYIAAKRLTDRLNVAAGAPTSANLKKATARLRTCEAACDRLQVADPQHPNLPSADNFLEHVAGWLDDARANYIGVIPVFIRSVISKRRER